jgi:very-short-patch-repair endonuclease
MSHPTAWLWAMEEMLDAIATRQYGLVTRRQLLAFLSSDQIEGWLADGRLVPVRPGVYRFQGAPPTWEQHLLAACLATNAVASHRSAARVWGLGRIAALRLEVTMPLGRVVRLNGVRAHRSTLLGPGFLTTHREIPVTTPARTLIDLSAVASPRRVRDAVDDALRERLVTLEELRACFDAMAGRGRRRVAHFRPILEARQPGYDPGDSQLEAKVARWLAAGGLPSPVRQHPVLTAAHRYRIDLAYPELRIAIELDGWTDHGTRNAFDHDRQRGNDLELAGWTVLRFTSRSTRDDVIRTVRAARAAATSRTLFTPTAS